MSTPLKLNNFDPKNLKFSNISSKKRSIKLFYNDSDLLLQLPRMCTPFGLQYFDNNDNKRFHIDLSFKTDVKDLNENHINELNNKLNQMDNFIVKKALEYSNVWFDSDYNYDDDEIRNMYKTIIKPNVFFPPNIHIKLPIKNDEFVTNFFDSNKNIINIDPSSDSDLDKIKPFYHIRPIIKCKGIWFRPADEEFGVTWEYVQCQVFPVEKSILVNKLKSYAFIDSDSD